MTDHQEVLAAFVDNEPVGAEDLSMALASAEGRDYLIDLLVLRGLVGDANVGRRVSYVAGGLQPAGQIRGAGQGTRLRGLWLTAAAAVLAAGVAGGFFAGRGTLAGRPPAANDVVQPVNSPSAPAPAPTHVIRMEKGVDWNERSGGN